MFRVHFYGHEACELAALVHAADTADKTQPIESISSKVEEQLVANLSLMAEMRRGCNNIELFAHWLGPD
jgi:hypothetical protein